MNRLSFLASLALLAVSPLAQAQSCPSAVTTGDASVWDSNTAEDAGNGVFPIGGSGQVNGDFRLCDTPGVQLGLRASERFQGTITPEAGSGLYRVAPGSDWNVDWHIDFVNPFPNGTNVAPLNLGETSTIIQLDCDPLVGEVNGPALDSGAAAPANTILAQSSQNPSFGFFCGDTFDFDADGSYEFSLTVTDTASQRVVSAVDITVQVGDNPPMPPVQPPVTPRPPPQPVPGVGALGQAGLITLLVIFGLLAVRRRF
ncbi:MAG: hypothetical protein AAGH19_12190 [Pseudomonadota bacterium]